MGQSESADWVGVEILNMFDMESQPTIVKSVVELADSGIESADSTADSATNPLRIGLCVRALRDHEKLYWKYFSCSYDSQEKWIQSWHQTKVWVTRLSPVYCCLVCHMSGNWPLAPGEGYTVAGRVREGGSDRCFTPY